MSSQPYQARYIGRNIAIDGRLSDEVWKTAQRAPFVDMKTGGGSPLKTETAVLWSDEYLYVGYWIEEPFPKATFTERDSLIWNDNDVELFIDGGDCYYEFEINAFGTIYEVFFIWRDAYKRGGRFDLPEFDILSRKALSFAGNYDRDSKTFWWGTHPRGARWAFLDWDMPGLQSAVHVDGHINDSTRPSRGWTVELAIPWAGMKHLANGRTLPPTSGDVWRMFLGRFQNVQTAAGEVQAAWCLTPHGVYDTHMPEKFTQVQFVK